MVVLEPEESARKGYSFVAGYGSAGDAPSDLCGGMVDAGRLAIAEANISVSRIDSINAWGPGHKLVDAGEVAAMHRLFGASVADRPAVSIKGAIGTPFAATGAIQVATVAMAHVTGSLPPTVNWEYPDPDCRLNLSNRRRDVATSATLVNSHGVGGINSSLVLERC